MDVSELHTLLQGAKEGSEYLDYAIQRVVVGMTKPVPPYSRSIDAAVQLLPQGWSIQRLAQLSDCRGGFGGWIGEIFRAADAMIPYPANGTAPTAALALCLAVVRALDGERQDAVTKALAVEPDTPLQRSGT
jgi:hypothetical protein